MRPRTIKNIFTIIYKGQQKIGIDIVGLDKHIYLVPANVKQCTGVTINEVEILIGSKIRPEFYIEGEKMFNSKINEGLHPIIKDFWIECEGSIDEMRNRNKDKLKPLKVIQKVFQFHRNGKDVVGFDTGDEKATFINTNRLQKLTQLSPGDFYILEGSFINPEYYYEGEELHGGVICNKSGVVLKELNLRYYGKIEEMHERVENKVLPYLTGNYDSYDYGNSYDSNNWLEDAAGSNDPEMMSDVYWNLD